jgi:hypothetical protein
LNEINLIDLNIGDGDVIVSYKGRFDGGHVNTVTTRRFVLKAAVCCCRSFQRFRLDFGPKKNILSKPVLDRLLKP